MSQVEEISETPPGATVVLPPHGFVNLEFHAPDDPDLWVANCARVSLRKREVPFDQLTDKEIDELLEMPHAGLIRFLLQNRHGTPFEHNIFCFHVRAPIGVLREWQRHRIGVSYNEESTRYVDVRQDAFIPDTGALRTQTGKPGRYTFEPMPEELGRMARILTADAYRSSYRVYEELLELGLAREVARNVLPLGHYSQQIFTCNARSLMNFASLRSAPTALREIRLYSDALLDLWRWQMPITAHWFSLNTAQAVAERNPDMLIAP